MISDLAIFCVHPHVNAVNILAGNAMRSWNVSPCQKLHKISPLRHAVSAAVAVAAVQNAAAQAMI